VRERSRFSLREIERRSSLNSGYLSQLERGKIAHPSPTVLRAVADGYGLRLDDVLNWAGYGPNADTPSANQAAALNAVAGLGEPTDEELETLTAIVNLLQDKRRRS
jgi:transcriptional regulator with XRE-family HTH domain